MIVEIIGFVVFFWLTLFFQYLFYKKKLQKCSQKLEEERLRSADLSLQIETHKNTNSVAQHKDNEKLLQQEIERLKKVIQDTTDIAQSANMIKNDFLKNVRHEVRTPLNAILSFAQIINNETENKNIKSYSHDIFQSGKKLLELLNNIIEMSAIDSNNITIKKNAIDLQSCLDSLIQIHKPLADEKQLSFELVVDPNMPKSIIIDSQRLKEILGNLISNAIRHTYKGGIEITISLDKFDESHHKADISFAVEDTGVGIALENQEKIFQIFESKLIENKIEYQGTGLGLSLNKKIAQLMNGNLQLKSIPAKGSVFTLSFKGVDVVLGNTIENVNAAELNFSLIQASSLMMIDSSEQTLNIFKNCFENTHINIYAYTSLRDAISLLQNSKIDLIFIDVQILTQDDNAVAKVLHKINTSPIIGLVQDNLSNVRFDSNGAKPIKHLKKPLNPIELFQLLLKHFNAQHTIIENGQLKNAEDPSKRLFFAQPEISKLFFEDAKSGLNELFVQAVQTKDLKTIENFASTLLKLSKKHRMKNLAIFGTKLLEKVDSFDIEVINQMLLEYNKESKEFLQSI